MHILHSDLCFFSRLFLRLSSDVVISFIYSCSYHLEFPSFCKYLSGISIGSLDHPLWSCIPFWPPVKLNCCKIWSKPTLHSLPLQSLSNVIDAHIHAAWPQRLVSCNHDSYLCLVFPSSPMQLLEAFSDIGHFLSSVLLHAMEGFVLLWRPELSFPSIEFSQLVSKIFT